MNPNALNTEQESTDQSNNFAVLQDSPSFDEHMQTRKMNPANRLQRVLDLAKVTEKRKNDAAFETVIQELHPNQAYNFLTHMNGILCDLPKRHRGQVNGMSVGNYAAPPPNIQGGAFAETTNALKDISNNHHRATLAYYMINALHIYLDGNGRTSRAVYEILDDPNFNLSDKRITHSKDEPYGASSGDQAPFENEKGISSTSEALSLAASFLKNNYLNSGKVDPCIRGVDTYIDTSDNTAKVDKTTDPDSYTGHSDIYFTPDSDNSESKLTSLEKVQISDAFQHNQATSSLALCIMLTRKGKLTDYANQNKLTTNNGNSILVFNVKDTDNHGNPNEQAREIFDGWTADDYREFLNLSHLTHRDQLKLLISFFKTPNNFPVSAGNKTITAAEYLSGK